jgi:hypothetical protein
MMITQMMRSRWIVLFCAFALSAAARADELEYTIKSVDSPANTLTLESGTLQAVTIHLGASASITVNGGPGVLGDLQPGMIVKVSQVEPGEAISITFERMAPTPQPTPITSIDAPDPLVVDGDSRKSLNITIIPRSPNAFVINDVRKGVKIELQYVSGTWKRMGVIAQYNPDTDQVPWDDRLALTLSGSGNTGGQVLAVVPPHTQGHPFVFEAQQDYPRLVLRINAKTFYGPGQVVYELGLAPPDE